MTDKILAKSAALLVLSAACLQAGERISNDHLPQWLAQRIHDWQPTDDERRFDQIGWLKDIREALRLGRENQRPVFLFTHDGRMAIGRC